MNDEHSTVQPGTLQDRAFNCIAVNTMDEGNFIALLIDTGQYRVLIDPGLGWDFFPGTTKHGLLDDRLRGLNISPAVFDFVMFSDADLDHVCGGVDATGNPAFASARYILRKEEWAFWTSKPDSRPCQPKTNALVDGDPHLG